MSEERWEIRNPKTEGRKKAEIRTPKSESLCPSLRLWFRPMALSNGSTTGSSPPHLSAVRFQISDFGLLSGFGLRPSDFPPPEGVTFVLPLCPNIDNTTRLNFTGF